ncbi:MAG: hypothetical protein ACLS4Z_05325 [Christensenellaceae bacterium]
MTLTIRQIPTPQSTKKRTEKIISSALRRQRSSLLKRALSATVNMAESSRMSPERMIFCVIAPNEKGSLSGIL